MYTHTLFIAAIFFPFLAHSFFKKKNFAVRYYFYLENFTALNNNMDNFFFVFIKLKKSENVNLDFNKVNIPTFH